MFQQNLIVSKKILKILFLATNFFILNPFNLWGQEIGDFKLNPPSLNYHYPDKQFQNGYRQIIFNMEGIDALNYFGQRLTDINQDGKIDILWRVKQHMSEIFRSPSGKQRAFITSYFDDNLNLIYKYDSTIIADGEKLSFFKSENEEFFFNYEFYDPTIVPEIGDFDWEDLFSKNDLILGRDYTMHSNNRYLEFNPRIYLISEHEFQDVTNEKLIYDESIRNSKARFMKNQSIAIGDLNNNGKIDFFTFGIHQVGEFGNDLEFANRVLPFFFKNIGNGQLYVDNFNFSSEFGEYYGVAEGSYHYVSNFDEDEDLEVLTEIWFSDSHPDPFQDTNAKRYLGYLDFDFSNKEVTFIKIFDDVEYLINPKYSISPREIKRIEHIQNKELILMFINSTQGSPPSRVGNLGEFLPNEIQQYFKVYEKKDGKLNDVTTDYFSFEESRTKSLNNSGSIHFIDVDQDGIIDIFPQLGQTPVQDMGGIAHFLKYPTWNNKTNTLYYFKGTESGKFKLTDYFDFQGFYYPQNFNFDYSIFNDQGTYKDQRLENFTAFNLTSIHDLNGDGNLEFLLSSQPDFLTLLTKKSFEYPKFATNKIESSSFQSNFIGDMISNYDFSDINFPADTVFLKLDGAFSQIFPIKDEERKISHYPEFFEMNPVDSLHTSIPPFVGNSKLIEKEEFLLKLILDISKFTNRDYFKNNAFIETKYNIPYYLRMSNDIYVKNLSLFGSNKNLAPLPFYEIDSKFLEAGDRRIEVEFSNSVDLNRNYHYIDGEYKAGLQYGYELYLFDSLIEEKIINNINYSTYDNNTKTKIYGFIIPINNLDFNKLNYKIFSLDSEDQSIKTYCSISDKTPPILKTFSNIKIYLNENGITSIDLTDVDNGSFDNVGITEMSLSRSSFTCSDLGENTITFTARDASGNESTAEVTVTVVDDTKPIVKSKSSYTIQLDSEGKAVLKWEDIDEGSTDNCGITERTLSKTEFTRDDSGEQTITYTVKDASGNTATAEIKVRVDVILSTQTVNPEKQADIKLYPNPAKNSLSIEFEKTIDPDQFVIEIVDASGRSMGLISTFEYSGKSLRIDTSELSNGVHFLRISSERSLKVLKFIIER